MKLTFHNRFTFEDEVKVQLNKKFDKIAKKTGLHSTKSGLHLTGLSERNE